MCEDEIINLIKTTTGCASGNLAKFFYKNEDYLNMIIKITNFLPIDATLIDRFYYIRNDLREIKKCKYCNKVLNKNLKVSFCSCKCNINYQNEYTDVIERRSKTLSENFKKKSKEEKDAIKHKRANTNFKKYGVTNNMHIPDVIDKKINTWIKNWGVDNPVKSDIIKNKIKETNIERYNSSTPLYGNIQKEIKKQTWIKNLGVDNPGKSKIVQQKMKDTYFKNTGYTHIMYNPHAVSKIRETWIKNQSLGKHKIGYKYKIYTFESGKKIYVQGYESSALDNYILKLYNEKDIENNISVMNSFMFEYEEPENLTKSNIKRRYIPDFYIKKDKLFIEIKSEYYYKLNIKNIYYKSKSVIDKGYNFYILISRDGKNFKKKEYEKIKIDFEKRNNE